MSIHSDCWYFSHRDIFGYLNGIYKNQRDELMLLIVQQIKVFLFFIQLVSFYFMVISSVNAGLIPQSHDVSLANENIIDFEYFEPVHYQRFVFSAGVFNPIDNTEDDYGVGNYGSENYYDLTSDFQGQGFYNETHRVILNFEHDISVLALAIVLVHSDWAFRLFDADDNLLTTWSLQLDNSELRRYTDFTVNNIGSVEFDPINNRSLFDSFSFVSQISEPSTWFMVCVALSGLALRRVFTCGYPSFS